MNDTTGEGYQVPLARADAPHASMLEVRRSRFYAQSFRAESLTEARSGIETIKRRHRDASHNCWAFVLGKPGDTAHIGSSDEGEPAGTAGRPILHVLLHSGIGEIAMVVTRWFGGIKLGTGGLARAYQESALANLRLLPLETRVFACAGKLSLPYSLLEPVKRLLAQNCARVESETYGEAVELEIMVPAGACSRLAAEIALRSRGEARLEFCS